MKGWRVRGFWEGILEMRERRLVKSRWLEVGSSFFEFDFFKGVVFLSYYVVVGSFVW